MTIFLIGVFKVRKVWSFDGDGAYAVEYGTPASHSDDGSPFPTPINCYSKTDAQIIAATMVEGWAMGSKAGRKVASWRRAPF